MHPKFHESKEAVAEVMKICRKYIRDFDCIPKTEFLKLFDKIDRLEVLMLEAKPDLTLADALKTRQTEKGLKGSMLPPEVYTRLYDANFFTVTEMASMTGTSVGNISNKVKTGRKELSTVEYSGDIGSSFDEMDPTKAYFEALKSIQDYINTKNIDADKKFKALDVLLRYIEPKVMEELKEKFETVNNLMTFLLDHLVPEANRRIREAIRQIKARNYEGEEPIVDLRLIFRDILPDPSELSDAIGKFESERAVTLSDSPKEPALVH